MIYPVAQCCSVPLMSEQVGHVLAFLGLVANLKVMNGPHTCTRILSGMLVSNARRKQLQILIAKFTRCRCYAVAMIEMEKDAL